MMNIHRVATFGQFDFSRPLFLFFLFFRQWIFSGAGGLLFLHLFGVKFCLKMFIIPILHFLDNYAKLSHIVLYLGYAM